MSKSKISDLDKIAIEISKMSDNEFEKNIANIPFVKSEPTPEVGKGMEEVLHNILVEDAAKLLLHDTVCNRLHNGISYEMVRKDLVPLAMSEWEAIQCEAKDAEIERLTKQYENIKKQYRIKQ